MASVVDGPWDGDAARFSDSQWAASCILDMGGCSPAGRDMTAKSRYKLPIREPGGAVNAHALGAAAGALAGSRTPLRACPAAKSAARRKLVAAYRAANLTPPDSLTAS